jgi:transglutaminase-like putative cysteine protease
VQLKIHHRTAYHYDEPVKYSAQALRLTPRREGRQRTISWSMYAPGRRTEQIDAHGNIMHLLTLEDLHRDIEIVVAGTVEVANGQEIIPHEGGLSPLAYLPCTPLTSADDDVLTLATSSLNGSGSTRDRLFNLATAVRDRVRYRPGVTTVEDSATAALARGEGVCQDQAHVFIACCRAAGIAARYVSGYLYVGKDDDAASHAWVDAWMEDTQAWLGVDVTHAEPTSAKHCRLAVGRDYLDAAPVRGVRRGGGREILDVDVTVTQTLEQQ